MDVVNNLLTLYQFIVKNQPQIVAIVLAGGQSSRMGRDKALIEIEGVPLLHKVCAAAQSCVNPVYVIAPWVVRYQSILPTGCQCLTEVPPPGKILPQGPLIAFAQALTQVEGEWVLLLACDLPNLTAGEIRRWCGYLTQVPPEAIALLPRHAKGWEPLCGFYRRRCLRSLQEFIAGGGSSFQRWLAENFVLELSVPDYRLLLNCNSPEDLPK